MNIKQFVADAFSNFRAFISHALYVVSCIAVVILFGGAAMDKIISDVSFASVLLSLGVLCVAVIILTSLTKDFFWFKKRTHNFTSRSVKNDGE